MYTKGILKIYTLATGGTNPTAVAIKAQAAGFDAMEFNGIIYIRCGKAGWFPTCFHITDFQDVQD